MQKNPTILTRGRKPVNFKDRTGLRYGHLVVVRHLGSDRNYKPMWECLCDCGTSITVRGTELQRGDTKSCGCQKSIICANTSRTHGMHGTPAYYSWAAMMSRCLNVAHPRYCDYGGRGITVCERWLKFENFFADMGKRPKGKTLDRINNDGGYELSNCRWATLVEQNNNTRQNRRITYQGETLNITQWSERTGLKLLTIHMRLKRGWSIQDALTVPTQGREKGI